MIDTLMLRDEAQKQLAQIKTVESGVEYLNKVKAIETWAKAEKKDAILQNAIAEQKIRTQKILGNLLKDSQVSKNSGSRHGNLVAKDDQVKLSDIGITKDQSSAFQKIASMPEELFEKEIAQAKDESNKRIELTTSRLLKAAKQYEKDVIRQKQSEVVKDIPVSENIQQGDSLEILKSLEDSCIDIVLTDPPYGIEYKSNRSEYDNSITKRGLLNDGKNEALTLLENTCKILKHKTAENAHLYFFCSWSVFSDFEKIIGKYFTIKTPIVWNKGNKGSGDLENDWGNQTELIIYCIKGKKNINYRKGNVLEIPKIHSSKLVHPTQKPTQLIKEILEVSALPNDFVVDPFMGSGSTIKACNEMNLKSLGIELDKEMFNIANKYINE
jgi:site-specific DNA-methyltransferase (adenine-specific)